MEVTQLVKETKLTYNTTPSSSTINLRNVYFTLRIAPAPFTYRERAFTTQYTQNSTKLAYKKENCCCAVDACDTAQRLQPRLRPPMQQTLHVAVVCCTAANIDISKSVL
jgi:hypothetical protein